MTKTLAFDVYGTLIDTHGVVDALEVIIGEEAADFSKQWRDKQLEYSFRHGLMNDYVDFSVCTRQALEYVAAATGKVLSGSQKDELMQAYSRLPAFSDVEDCLKNAQASGCRIFAFSNGSAAAVSGLLEHAGISGYFEGTVSVETMRTFKPNPAVYQHFLDTTQSAADRTWLISSNPFDVIGAAKSNWQTVWVQRSQGVIFDTWGVKPTTVINRLDVLNSSLSLAAE